MCSWIWACFHMKDGYLQDPYGAARFSPDDRYRYLLKRRFGLPAAANPTASTKVLNQLLDGSWDTFYFTESCLECRLVDKLYGERIRYCYILMMLVIADCKSVMQRYWWIILCAMYVTNHLHVLLGAKCQSWASLLRTSLPFWMATLIHPFFCSWLSGC